MKTSVVHGQQSTNSFIYLYFSHNNLKFNTKLINKLEIDLKKILCPIITVYIPGKSSNPSMACFSFIDNSFKITEAS
jgi:hypothetical protein